MKNNLVSQYTAHYQKTGGRPVYPSEFIVRIFQGNYPRLNLPKDDYKNCRLLDIGCGDGRNLEVYYNLGFEVFGSEISDEICQVVRKNIEDKNIKANIVTGFNHNLPFGDQYFDYLVSWNSCYYMGEAEDHFTFGQYIDEYQRIIKNNGTMVVSVPAPDSFIYNGSEEISPGYRRITNDPYLIRNNHVFRFFEDIDALISDFEPAFENFRTGFIHDDCFGQMNSWFLMVCNKKKI